jgi:hypothetical protein
VQCSSYVFLSKERCGGEEATLVAFGKDNIFRDIKGYSCTEGLLYIDID